MTRIIIYTAIIISFLSCEGPEGEMGPRGFDSLVRTTNEPAGDNCQFGGVAIEYGLDTNTNGVLDDDEITNTEYVCSGVNSLINISSVAAGAECSNGGIRIDSGIDTNKNSILDQNEIDVSHFICNGNDGQDGSDGSDGQNGGGGGNLELVRLYIGETSISNNTSSWMMKDHETEFLINFDKANYPEADSITVGFLMATSVNDGSVRCFAELYDVTNGQSIPNTQMESTQFGESNALVYQFSNNIIDDLPDGNITLAVRARSETDGTIVFVSPPSYMMIYKN